jgi:hypothetical protein
MKSGSIPAQQQVIFLSSQSVLDHLLGTLILQFQWVTGAILRSEAVRA